MESFLFPTRAWSRRWFGNCHWLPKRIHWLALLRSQEKRAKLFCLSWPVLFSWVMDTLDPSSDDDINNDVNSLYIEIIEQECTICGRKLSRKQKDSNPLELCSRQRWETTQANHNFECHYKLCFTVIFYKKDTEATICDYRGALEFSSTNGYAQSEGKFMYEDLPLFMK